MDPRAFGFFHCVVAWVVREYACLVGYGGCGHDAVAHGDIFVLAFDEAGLFGDGWGQVLDLQSAFHECMIAGLCQFFSSFFAGYLDDFRDDDGGQYSFVSACQFSQSSCCFLFCLYLIGVEVFSEEPCAQDFFQA